MQNTLYKAQTPEYEMHPYIGNLNLEEYVDLAGLAMEALHLQHEVVSAKSVDAMLCHYETHKMRRQFQNTKYAVNTLSCHFSSAQSVASDTRLR